MKIKKLILLLTAVLSLTCSAQTDKIENWCAAVVDTANISVQYPDETDKLIGLIDVNPQATDAEKRELRIAVYYGALLKHKDADDEPITAGLDQLYKSCVAGHA